MKPKPHLFPHSYLPETMLGRIVSFFGPVSVCLPWFMDTPGFFKDYELEIINPPEDLRPEKDFKAFVSGYRTWAGMNQDRSRREILKLSGNSLQADGAIWDIRRMLKGADHPGAETRQELSLKRHLLLHLASEVEKGRFEIMDMMEGLKEKGSLLAGAIHDQDEAQGLFADMYDLTPGIRDNMNIRLILDAWFGLFNGCRTGCGTLITCSKEVLDYISSQWEDMVLEGETAGPYFISFSLPDTSSGRYKERDITKIRELILGFGEGPEHNMPELQGLLRGFEKDLTGESSKGIMRFEMRYFPSMPGGTPFEGQDILSHVAGKTVILIS